MPFEATKLGPFTGGMNTRQKLDSIADDQVSLLQNMDTEPDGSFTSRPAIVQEWAAVGTPVSIVAHGYYVRDDGEIFLVATIDNATTQIYSVSAKTWTTIWSTAASGYVQYDNKIVLCAETGPGGHWEGGTFTADATMPAASGIVLYQERLWAFGKKGTTDQATLWFSNITAISPPTSIFTWTTASDFILVNDGDGQWITALLPTAQGLYIFRNQSTYNWRYPSAPISGTLSMVDATIGADNQRSVGRYETSYYVLNRGYFYEFLNGRYWPTSMDSVSLETGAVLGGLAAEVRLSIFGRRALIWYFGSLYCYSFATKTWSLWRTNTYAAHYLELPTVPPGTDARRALAISGSTDPSTWKLYSIDEAVLQGGDGEMFTCMVRTKAYSMDQPLHFKRMSWWGAELRARGDVTGGVFPVAVPEVSEVTWLDMEDYGWLDFGTWLNPLVKTQTIADVAVDPSGPSTTRVSVRFGHDVQFMNAYFELTFTCDGTIRTGPARIFSMTPYLSLRGTVTKKVT